jgi:hypothetical protein
MVTNARRPASISDRIRAVNRSSCNALNRPHVSLDGDGPHVSAAPIGKVSAVKIADGKTRIATERSRIV